MSATGEAIVTVPAAGAVAVCIGDACCFAAAQLQQLGEPRVLTRQALALASQFEALEIYGGRHAGILTSTRLGPL